MKIPKRMMATLLCLAMLLSGFAMADEEIDPAQGQEQVQSVTDSQSGEGHSEPEVTTGDEEDKKDAVDAVTSADSAEDGAGDSTDNPADDSAPDADQNDSEQGEDDAASETGEQGEDDAASETGEQGEDDAASETGEQGEDGDASDGAADEPETPDGEESSEDSQEPGKANGETGADEDDATDETEDANADINLLSNEQDVDLGAADDSDECLHESDPFKEESFEATGVVECLNEDKHSVHYTYRWKTTCLDCGKVLDEGEEEIEELYDHNFTTDSEKGEFTCEACGYSFKCDHKGYLTTETITEPAYDLEGYVGASDESGHKITVHEWTQEHCEKCDWRGPKNSLPDRIVNEPHEWDEESGGKVCLKCGWTNACTHENWEYKDEWDDVVRATKLNAFEHTAERVFYADKVCKDCGWIIERGVERYRSTETQDHWLNELSDGTIGCTAPGCGYVVPCEHPDAFREKLTREGFGPQESEPVNEKQHRVRRLDQTYYRCKICGHEWGEDYPDDTAKVMLENHQWNNEGYCEICGYENKCKVHDFQPVATGVKKDGTIDYRCLDERTHEVTIGLFEELACTKCGFTIVDHIDDSTNQTFVEDHYWLPDGTCAVCGVKGFCQHPDEYVEKLTGLQSRDDLGAIDSNPEEHTVYADRYVNYHCTRCDAWWGYDVVEYCVEQTEPHVWDSDEGKVCVICGHENNCTHVGTTEDIKEDDFRIIPSMTTATTHSKNPYVVGGKHCTKCNAYFGRKATGGTDAIVTEPHKFVYRDGKTVCEVCGYIKPEQKVESTKKTVSSEKKTEESAFEEIADGTVVHGVTVGEPTRMGVTMAQAMAGIASEYGADAKIEIQNIDKVLTADECVALNALPPTERILVVLGAIGYGDEVESALAELQLTLSEEAQALSQKVNARVAQMDDAAKAAHQKAIAQYFANANGLTITLEIRKAGETGAIKERYGFVQANGGWQFAKLEIAKA